MKVGAQTTALSIAFAGSYFAVSGLVMGLNQRNHLCLKPGFSSLEIRHQILTTGIIRSFALVMDSLRRFGMISIVRLPVDDL